MSYKHTAIMIATSQLRHILLRDMRKIGLVRFYNGHGTHKSNDSATNIDMRSDTVTKPDKKMRQAMADAEVGDDVFGEDPTVNALQKRVAKMTGMEAALFVPTGTMGNLISVLSHCQTRGLEAILGDKAHLVMYEQGGMAQLGSVHPRTVENFPDGTFDLTKVREIIRPRNDPHQPITELICVENTHNLCGGKILPIQFLDEVGNLAKEHGIKVHTDGARVMNAAVGLGVPLKRVLQSSDSVSICLSKGLGAPVGSIIAGKEDFIARALRLRKVLGGGMRQSGVLAAAAMVALDGATETLQRDHKHGKILAQALKDHGQGVVDIDVDQVHTNILFIQIKKDNLTAGQFCDRLRNVSSQEAKAIGQEVSLQMMEWNEKLIRAVVHTDIREQDLQLAIEKLKHVFQEIQS